MDGDVGTGALSVAATMMIFQVIVDFPGIFYGREVVHVRHEQEREGASRGYRHGGIRGRFIVFR
jgi:hypothetical protein